MIIIFLKKYVTKCSYTTYCTLSAVVAGSMIRYGYKVTFNIQVSILFWTHSGRSAKIVNLTSSTTLSRGCPGRVLDMFKYHVVLKLDQIKDS